ncbi:transposase [Flavobacterium sp. ASV13]|uniref:transposase n=1 Tax=Flavobacterium sp. ASV13 TaxID=1506583 RepID=UPI00068CD0F7|nr:transposase [Flavobacterium sp. ASV13]
MKENKKSYSADFKRNAVMLSFKKETIDIVAQKLNISNRTLLQWRKNYIIFGEAFTTIGKTKLKPEEKKIYELEMKIKKLNIEFDIINGASDYLHKGLPTIYQYIAEKDQIYSSYLICKTLGVHLGTYKKWKNKFVSERQKWKMMVKQEIMSIFLASQQRYGSKRITAELQRSGYQLSSNTVLIYMRELNLSVSVKKYKIKT